ncbi:DUF3742 family protein [Pantoea sp. S62]|uniref:DUF3742 family protein n=1 Tax=Pantoea sp. S62 TaxID=2769342 RepID=UPI00191178C3|nr:DUF3742 family protein [Pantoea sp. S62]
MSSTAYARGTKAASVWKHLSRVYFDADDRFAAWAERKKIPASIGKSVVPVSVLLLMTLAIVAGFAFAAVIIIVAAFVYMVRHIQLSGSDDLDSTSSNSSCAAGGQFRSGNDGEGFYSGPDDITVTASRLDREDDD